MMDRLDDARNASLRARDLAQQLLAFARGGAPIKKAASIADLIEETVSFSLRGSHGRSVLAIAPDLWSAEFDPGQISQVIANLVVNAEQAMPDGGTLHVDCDNFAWAPETAPSIPDLAPGDYIRIRLRDEGVGIPEQILKQIFDPYFTTKPNGNGLGLATTYSIVKNHHGLITVESEQQCGSTFTVYLPSARREAAPVKPAAASSSCALSQSSVSCHSIISFSSHAVASSGTPSTQVFALPLLVALSIDKFFHLRGRGYFRFEIGGGAALGAAEEGLAEAHRERHALGAGHDGLAHRGQAVGGSDALVEDPLPPLRIGAARSATSC
jgi:hypothetical protein